MSSGMAEGIRVNLPSSYRFKEVFQQSEYRLFQFAQEFL